MDAIFQPDLDAAAASAGSGAVVTRSVVDGRDDLAPVPFPQALPATPTPAATRADRSHSRGELGVSSWAAAVEEMDAANLRSLVVSLPTIEQAKGVLMGCYGCSPDVAFAILRRWSSTRQVKVRDLAAALVDHVSRGPTDEPGPSSEPTSSSAPGGEGPPFRGLRAFLEANGFA